MKTGVMKWTGRVLSGLAVFPFIPSFIFKVLNNKEVQEGWTRAGYPASTLMPIAITELACVVFYVIPQTSILGAILLTGYLGGAIATHVRQGESIIAHIIIGVLVWGGLFLREPRLRQILPFRQPLPSPPANTPPKSAA